MRTNKKRPWRRRSSPTGALTTRSAVLAKKNEKLYIVWDWGEMKEFEGDRRYVRLRSRPDVHRVPHRLFFNFWHAYVYAEKCRRAWRKIHP